MSPRNASSSRGGARPPAAPHVVAISLFLLTAARAAENPAALSAADLQFFETKIRPVLTDQCYKCHSHQADRVKGGLMLDSRDALLKGGNTGPAVVPGNPDDSVLIQAYATRTRT